MQYCKEAFENYFPSPKIPAAPVTLLSAPLFRRRGIYCCKGKNPSPAEALLLNMLSHSPIHGSGIDHPFPIL